VYLFAEGFGSKDAPTVPITADTPFRVASVSKTFVVAGLLHEVEAGNVRLDDELRTIAPDFVVANPFGRGQPTFRQVASQMAGLQREVPGCTDANGCNVTTAAVLASLLPLQLPPNWRPSYSNLGFDLLGHLLAERLRNQTFAAWLQATVLGPLGLTATGVTYPPSVRARLPTPYSADGTAAPFTDFGWGAPDGGAYTTARDAATFLRFWLDGYATSALRRENLQPKFVNPTFGSGFGAPWEMYRAGDYFLRTKSGDLPGGQAQLILAPELGVGLAAFWNGEGQSFSVQTELAELVLPALAAEAAAAFVASLPAVPEGVLAVARSTNAWAGPFVFKLAVASARADLVQLVVTAGPPGAYWMRYLGTDATTKEYRFHLYLDLDDGAAGPPSCMITEFLSTNGAVVTLDGDLEVAAMPGEFPTKQFIKQNSGGGSD
jgi:CubicO group peptidase (beta-lactamase class C family)